MMAPLRCAVRGCASDTAVTIFRGYALCDACDTICDAIPDTVPADFLERIIADVISGEYTVADSLLKRGYTRPRDRPYGEER